MSLYVQQFDSAHDFETYSGSARYLVLASAPRCGSHMLGHLLHQTGAFGYPLEYLNTANLAEWKKRFKVRSVEDVLANIQRYRTSPNGVFSIKIHYSHLKNLGGYHQLDRYFPNAHYIILHRKDLVKQAVSYAISRQTGVWISGQEGNGEEPVYHFRQINKCLRRLLMDMASWRYTLELMGASYTELYYENILSDIPGAITRIAEQMDISLDPQCIPDEPVTERQSNTRNQEWAQRFLQEAQSKELSLWDKRGGSGWFKRLAGRG